MRFQAYREADSPYDDTWTPGRSRARSRPAAGRRSGIGGGSSCCRSATGPPTPATIRRPRQAGPHADAGRHPDARPDPARRRRSRRSARAGRDPTGRRNGDPRSDAQGDGDAGANPRSNARGDPEADARPDTGSAHGRGDAAPGARRRSAGGRLTPASLAEARDPGLNRGRTLGTGRTSVSARRRPMRSYLIVANQTLASPTLAAAVAQRVTAGETTFHVVVPRTPIPHGLTWDEDEAERAAQRAARPGPRPPAIDGRGGDRRGRQQGPGRRGARRAADPRGGRDHPLDAAGPGVALARPGRADASCGGACEMPVEVVIAPDEPAAVVGRRGRAGPGRPTTGADRALEPIGSAADRIGSAAARTRWPVGYSGRGRLLRRRDPVVRGDVRRAGGARTTCAATARTGPPGRPAS